MATDLAKRITDDLENQAQNAERSFAAERELPRPGDVSLALLTGGADRPYAFGLATELISQGARIDVIGNDDLDGPEFHGRPHVTFHNLRGDQSSNVSPMTKANRVLKYYARLIRYVTGSKTKIFHILWNNKFEYFDRTILMLYYKLLGKKIVLTIHNVNKNRRDKNDTALNRRTLKIQYHLADHLFVHTEKMKEELREEFHVDERRVTVIPFGINNAVPNTSVTPGEARQRLGLGAENKVLLFFGHITPYKGLEYLVDAFRQARTTHSELKLVIAGRPKNCDAYWRQIQESIQGNVETGDALVNAEFIPDEETEIYFKAADVLVLPYRHVYQSGVIFLGYSFGLPVLAADVGSLKDDVSEGKTGFMFEPENSSDLARAIDTYFASDLFKNLAKNRQLIRNHAIERNSWSTVGQTTMQVYSDVLHHSLKRA